MMMRTWKIFTKCAREQKRDLWVLLLTLAFAPLFVFLYWLMTGAGSATVYDLLVINHDSGFESLQAGDRLVAELKDFKYENGASFLHIIGATDRSMAEKQLRNREAAALLIIPADLSEAVMQFKSGQVPPHTQLEFVGDLANPAYVVTAVAAMTVADRFLMDIGGQHRVVDLLETPLGASAARTEFENYVPGLFIFAVVMVIFQAAMLVARESEGGKLIRLRLAGLSSLEFLGGVSAWLVLVSMASAALAFGIACAFGFTSQGPIWLAVIVILVTSLSVIGAGMIVAGFSQTVTQAFIIANFPFGLLLFLTGAVFPLPRVDLFTIAGHGFAVYDLLPPTHAVVALNKIFTMGTGLADMAYEIVMLAILSAVYFGLGVFFFRRKNLS